MGIYVGSEECRVIYVARNGQQLRVSSVWVGDQQVFPPANRQEIHVFNRGTQGYGRTDNGTHFAFSVPVPWWSASMDVVMIGAGEKGRDGTKSFTGGSDGAGGKSGAWAVRTVALTQSTEAVVRVGKGISTSPHATEIILPGVGGQADVRVYDGEGTRTANSGSTGGTPSPSSRAEYDRTHVGGTGGSRNSAGQHPGGGGGGGQGSGLIGNPQSGRDGGDGYVWIRFRSAPALDPGDVGFILRVGVASWAAYGPLRAWAVSIGKTYQTITEITVPMEVIGPSLDSLFDGCRALTSVPDLDTSQVTNMRFMFYNCWSLTSVPALDSGQVTDVQYMFAGCLSLESVTLPGMGGAFTSKGTLDMSATVLNATAANALMQSLGTVPAAANGTKLELPSTATGADTSIASSKNWTVTISDVLRVGVPSGVAYGPLRAWAVGIGKTYQTITEITVPLVVVAPSLYALFDGCEALESIPAMDTTTVTDMQYMFAYCSSLTSVPNLDTSNVTNMESMFAYCSTLTTIPALNTSKVTNTYDMFNGCSSLATVTLPGMGQAFSSQQTLGMKDTKLNATAANALMQSLGTPPPGGTLQLPSTAAGADTSIASSKNWTVTIG